MVAPMLGARVDEAAAIDRTLREATELLGDAVTALQAREQDVRAWADAMLRRAREERRRLLAEVEQRRVEAEAAVALQMEEANRRTRLVLSAAQEELEGARRAQDAVKAQARVAAGRDEPSASPRSWLDVVLPPLGGRALNLARLAPAAALLLFGAALGTSFNVSVRNTQARAADTASVAYAAQVSRGDLLNVPIPSLVELPAPRTFRMLVTGYSDGPAGGAIGSTTASGKTTRWGVVAADPTIFPFGTRLAIDGFDTIFVVEDTGEAIVGARLDVWFPDPPTAFRFGVQERQVVALPAPGSGR